MSRNNRCIFILAALFLYSGIGCTQAYLDQPYRFAHHLIENGKYEDAQHVLNKVETAHVDQDEQLFCKVKSFYLQGEYEALLRLGDSNELHTNARAALIYRQALLHLEVNPESFESKDDSLMRLAALQNMAWFAMNGDADRYKAWMDSIQFESNELANAEFILYLKSVSQANAKPDRKPWVAALMSGIVPGSGRVYARKGREGLTSLFPILLYGSQAAEGFYLQGFASPHFYVFSPITLAFYLSNIYGSAKAASRTNEENNLQLQYEVFDLLDPLVLGR